MLDRPSLDARRKAAAPEVTVRDRIAVLVRRKTTILLTTAACVALALGYSLLQKPVYASSARLLLQPRSTESLFDQRAATRVDPARAVRNEIVVLESEPVRAAVRAAIGTAPPVDVAPLGDTDAIRVTAEDRRPARAARIANAYAQAYISFRHKQVVDDLQAASQEVRAKVADLDRQIAALDAQVSAAPDEQQEARRAALAPQRQALLSTQSLFRQQLDQIQVEVPLQSGGAQLIAEARAPNDPVRPNPVRNGVLALILGLGAGVGLAFLRDHLDDSIKTKDELEHISGGRPVVGMVPLVGGSRSRAAESRMRVVSLDEPTSPAAEAYRTVRTAVQFLSLERPLRSVLVTSASAGEGKTTTVANLGVVLARAGFKVVVVDCDLRRPNLHQRFGVANAVGFTSVLLGEAPLEAALQPVAGVDRLRVLASGAIPPNPSELLSLRRTNDAIINLGAEGSILLLDSPPVLAVTDALVLSSKVDAVLLVAAAGSTTKKDAARAVELLDQVDAPLVGTVLNGVVEQGAYGYRYQYRPDGKAMRRETARW